MADTSAAALAHIDRVSALLTGPELRELTTPGAAAGRDAARAVGRDLGPLSHMGRGVRLSAGYDLDHGYQTIIIRLRPAGAWVIAQKGAEAHLIQPKARRRRAARGQGRGRPAIGVGDGAVARLDHPGAAGRRGIDRAFGRARRAIPDAIHDAQVAALRRIYGAG